MEPEAPEPISEPQTGLPFQLNEGAFERPPIRPLYRVSLVLVSIAMILLPLVYLGLVGLFGFSVYWYATHFSWFLNSHSSGRGSLLVIEFAYFVPLFAGCVLFLFMVKPPFAPRPTEEGHFSLELADAPKLFSFLGWICRSLNAPIPSRVDVDCSVNASAGFRSGFSSFFGNDIVLTIGLPLVAGLNVNQLAGVIAHEYGHFSQGAGMRASFLIRRINFWLYRVVYERDAWDLWLIANSEDAGDAPRSALVFFFIRLAVWLGRRPAWLLFVLGHFLSSFMSRQMEFDADRYQLKMSGSDSFIATSLRLQQLMLGTAIAQKQTRAKWKKEKKLFDQIPDFIVSRANEIPADAQRRHFANAYQQKTGYFDSHPSDAERVGRARDAREPGVLDATDPAKSLFANYPELSRRATEFFYREMIGPTFTPDWLDSTEQAAAQVEHDYSADRLVINNYFMGLGSNIRPVTLPEEMPRVFRSPEALIAELRACREQMRQSLPAARSALATFHQADSRHLQLHQAATLVQSGFAIDSSRFELPDGDTESPMAEATQALQSADATLQSFEHLAKTRLIAGIQLLRSPLFAQTLPDAPKLQQHLKDMLFAQARLAHSLPVLFNLRVDCFALDAILRHRREQGPGDNLTQSLENFSTKIRDHIYRIQEQIGQIRHPFPHAVENAFVSDYARNKEYYPDPVEATLREGASHVEKLLALHERLLANVIEICEKVEIQAGI